MTGRWCSGSEIDNYANFVTIQSLNRSVCHGRRRNGGPPRLNQETLLKDNHMNNDSLTPTGESTSRLDTACNPNPNPEGPDKTDGSQTSPPKPTLSEARLRANRENAKKSTGPKTARGKAYSRLNSLKHGILIDRVLFSSDGTPINEELHDLWDSLQAEYGSGDVGTELLLESLVVEWWRLRAALDIEMSCFKNAVNHLGPMGSLPNLQRYARRASGPCSRTSDCWMNGNRPCRTQPRTKPKATLLPHNWRTCRKHRSPRAV